MKARQAILITGLLVLGGCGGGTKAPQDDTDTDPDVTDTTDMAADPDAGDGTDAADAADTSGDGDATAPECGNCILEGSEQCDDCNTTNGDGCDDACMVETPPHCGDCVVDYDEMEQCDDCNTTSGDGCSSTCQIEAPPHCGDGHLDIHEGEQCDDGNTDAGDGCSPTCQFETVGGTCGDSTTDYNEVCDDGNLINGDSCNPTCNLTNTTEVFVGSQGVQGNVDGVGTSAQLGGFGTLTNDDTHLYYADGNYNVIKQVDISTRTVVTIAGDGTAGYLDDPVGTSAQFPWVETLATDGITLWVGAGNRIRAVSLTAPYAVTTVAGSGTSAHTDGIGTAAEFDDLRGLVYYDGYVYLLDSVSATLRRFDPSTNEVVTLAGTPYATGTTDGVGSAARFISPRYQASDNSGMIYVADTNGNKIRAFNTMTTEVTTFAGDGTSGYIDAVGTAARIHRPRGMTSDGTSVYWAEFNQHTIRQGVLATQNVSTLVGTHCGGGSPCTGGYSEGIGTGALFTSPVGMAFHFPTNSLYVVDGGNFVIRRIY